MAELHETRDPRELVPGDPSRIFRAASAYRASGTTLAGTGKSARGFPISSWEGTSAEAYRARLNTTSGSWMKTGDRGPVIGGLLDEFAHTLVWAQREAAEAAAMYWGGAAGRDNGAPPARSAPGSGRPAPTGMPGHPAAAAPAGTTPASAGEDRTVLAADAAVERDHAVAGLGDGWGDVSGMSQRDREDQERKQAAIDRLAQARSVLHERGNRISNDLQRELDALTTTQTGRMIEHTGTTTDLTPPATGPTAATTPATAPPAPPSSASAPVSAVGGPVAAVAPIPATMPAGAAPPIHSVDTGGDPGSCEPGPGRFTAQQWNALPANDPRRTHETVVVDPPTMEGRHDNLVRISERTLGSSSRWPEIWNLNRGLAQPDGRPLASPSLIHPGDVLAVPRGPGTPGTTPEGQPAHPNSPKPDELEAAKPQQPPVFDAGPAKTTGDGLTVWLPGALIAGGALAAALAVCAPDDAPGGGQRGTRGAGVNKGNSNGEGGWLPELGVPEALKRLRGPALTAGDADLGQRQRPIGEPLHTPSGSPYVYPRYAGQGSRPDLAPAWEQTGASGHVGGWTPAQDPHSSQPPPAAGSWTSGPPAPDPHRAPDASVLDARGARSAPVRPVEQAVCASVGVRDGHTVGIDLTTTGGLHMTGRGARAATRALLLGLLGNTLPTQPTARIVIDTAFARDLLGVEDSTLAALTAVEQLVLTEDIDQSLDLVEFEITRRVRQSTNPPAGGFAPIVLFTPHNPEHASRQTSITAMGADFRCASITTHTDPDADVDDGVDDEAGAVEGSSVHVAVDGTVVIAVAPYDLAHALAGTRLFIAALDYTRDQLTGPTRAPQEPAAVASAAEPETTGDDPEEPETGPTATTSTASGSPPPDPGPDTAGTAPTEGDAALPRGAGQDHERDDADARGTPHQQPLGAQRHSDESRHSGHDEPHASMSNPTEAGPGGPVVARDAALAISCLGSFTVRARTQPGEGWRDITGRFSPLLRTLLGFVITQQDGAATDELLEVGWADTSYKGAQQRLQTAVSAIRRILRHATGEQHGFIDRREDRYHLITSGVWVDYREFTRLVTQARATGDQAERAGLLRRAADLYGGPPLPGINTDWADTARHTVGRDATWVLTSLAALETEPEQALVLLERANRHDPADQTTARAVIEQALALDRPEIAQRTHRRHADALAELGVAVDPVITAQLIGGPTTPPPAAEDAHHDRDQRGDTDDSGEDGGLAWPA